MDVLVVVAQVVSALAVLAGVAFAMIEARHYKERKARESALALARSYYTIDFAEAVFLIGELSAGMSRKELTETLGGNLRQVALLMTTWESLGVLVYRGELSIDLVDDLYSGVIVLSWNKLFRFVEEVRAETGRETYFEWFQWLGERFAEREANAPPHPAYNQFKAWTPK